MIKSILIALMLTFTIAVSAQPNEEIELMGQWFAGEYTTTGETLIDEQAGHQHMRIFRIWESHPDLWLYLEQSRADAPETPHRQWILRIEESQKDLYLIEPHLVPNAEELQGQRTPAFIEKHVKIDDLGVLGGCEFFVDYDGFVAFSGSTVENFCDTDLREASVLRIKFNLMENKIDWWEQGFNDEGKQQLWGAGKDPQVFRKK
jgi:hypothetical protein